MCQGVVVGDTRYYCAVTLWLVGAQIGVEVAGMVVVNLIARLRLVR